MEISFKVHNALPRAALLLSNHKSQTIISYTLLDVTSPEESETVRTIRAIPSNCACSLGASYSTFNICSTRSPSGPQKSFP